MDISTWFRGRAKGPETASSRPLRAAAAGAETSEILKLAAREFCAAAQADRIGIWLLDEENSQALEGVVIEQGEKPVLPEWRSLDRTMPMVEMLLSSVEPVVVDLHKVPQAAALGPLARMRSAAWIPLRSGGRPLGLVLVACSLSRLRAIPAGLRELADELVLVVSERHARAALDRLRAEWLAILDSAEDRILVLDASGWVRFTNAQFASLFGLPRGPEQSAAHGLGTLNALADWLEGELVWAGAPEARPGESFANHWRDLRSRSEQNDWDKLELLRPKHRWLERRPWPVKDSRGQIVGWLEVFRDVTQQRESRARMQQAEKLAALGQIVSGVAHELSNPLTSILGYAQLLLGVRSGQERQADMRRVYQEAERARRIVNNLLLFARESKLERRPADLNEIVKRTLALRGYELTVENILIETALAPNLPQVLVDSHQIQQVLLNLLVNAEQAILHSHPENAGGRTRGQIRVRTYARGDRVLLEVADTGPGIPVESEGRIFDPFFTTKPIGQGTGLGLSIAHGIVQEHGGRIYVQRGRTRDTHSGATLVVELPVHAVAPASGPGTPERRLPAIVPYRAQKDAAPGFRARVLVVEDEPTVAQLVADVLEDEGHEVETVLDSREGLERARQNSYDLLMCDLRMPHLDGRGLYDALLHSGADLDGRVIFITGDTLSPRTLDFLEKNNLPYLAKPFLVEELKAAVSAALGRRGAESNMGRAPSAPAIIHPRKNHDSRSSDSRRDAVRKK